MSREQETGWMVIRAGELTQKTGHIRAWCMVIW